MTNNEQRPTLEDIINKHDKPECYHAICQYSSDGCSKCEYSGDCHLHFLTHMFIRGEEKSNDIQSIRR